MKISSIDFYKDIFDNCPDMILVVDMRTRKILECNQTIQDKLGYTHQEILEMSSFNSLYHPDCHSKLEYGSQYYAREGNISNFLVDLKTKSGLKIPISLNAVGIKDDEGRVSYSRVILRDISNLAKGEHLEKKNQALSTLIQLISHDFKAPLLAIDHLATWVIEDCKGILPDESEQNLLLIKQRIKRAEQLLEDLRKYFMSDYDGSRIIITDLDAVFHDILNSLEVPPGFQIINKINLPPFSTKKVPLQQVFCNLVLNSIRHHHNPSQGKIWLQFKERPRHYLFAVQDNGPGIPQRYHKKIFDLLKRLESQDTMEGSGMGLPIVKKIINNKGGMITVRSRRGKGSSFIFTWPKFFLKAET